MATQETFSYIAKPEDSRCAWWCVQVPADVKLDGQKLNGYVKRGADLELAHGEMLIDSEANHHRNNRGYTVTLVVSFGDSVGFITPSIERKKYIKANGGQDLMSESGDINGCIRMAIWLRRQPDLKAAFEQLKSV